VAPRSADRRRAGWCYIAIQSLLKAGGGLCQAMILVGGDRVDPVDLRLRLDLIITTSPSPLMYGSIDGWRGHLALNGKLIDGALERANLGQLGGSAERSSRALPRLDDQRWR
jgi:arginine/lysine/ornithine decarboxylase